MALNKKRDPHMESLILHAAADIQRLNPHISAPQQPPTEEECAELERERQEVERVWEEIDRQHGGLTSDEPAAQAVDEDRGT